MTRFELWFMRRVLRREVRQCVCCDKRISRLYGLIREACEQEFTEDTGPSLDAFLAACFQRTQAGFAEVKP